jgi:hypothetical protein
MRRLALPPSSGKRRYDINLLTDTEGTILIDSSLSSDRIDIDANIEADVRIRGMLGNDQVFLFGRGESRLRSFSFLGEGGNDTFTIDHRAGDALPGPGFDFTFDGGHGNNSAQVIELNGTTRNAYFVNIDEDIVHDNVVVLNEDAVDVNTGDTFVDALTDINDGNHLYTLGEQITLRAAIQRVNALAVPAYIFLPEGIFDLDLIGSGGANQGDLDITGNVLLNGSGAGVSVISATGLGDRVFEVQGAARSLTASRLTLTGGHALQFGGGAVFVHQGGAATLDQVAVVNNRSANVGGGVWLADSTSRLTVRRSVFTANTADNQSGGAIAVHPSMGGIVAFTVASTIFARNTAATGSNIYLAPNSPYLDQGGNLLDNADLGSANNGFNGIPGGAVEYVVTSVGDSFNHADDGSVLSIRDAIDRANGNVANDDVWLPAWNFVLTRERAVRPDGVDGSNATDIDVAFGDLDIMESLTVRGIDDLTGVRWRMGIVDAIFDLSGDYNGDGIENGQDSGIVDAGDYTVWRQLLGLDDDLRADGNDNGIVDQADWLIWKRGFNNSLTMTGVN